MYETEEFCMTHRTNIERRNRITLYMNMFYLTYGKQPSVREIGKAVGISSTSTVSGYLRRMEKDGTLARSEARNRSYFVVAAPETEERERTTA